MAEADIDSRPVIVWKTGTASLRIASVRYRCMLPAMLLEESGYRSLILERGETLRSLHGVCAVILVKTFSREDLRFAERAHRAGIPVVLDLCDNIFVPGYGGELMSRWAFFGDIARLASVIVTTNGALTREVMARVPGVATTEIVDPLERRDDVERLGGRVAAWREHPALARSAILDGPLWRGIRGAAEEGLWHVRNMRRIPWGGWRSQLHSARHRCRRLLRRMRGAAGAKLSSLRRMYPGAASLVPRPLRRTVMDLVMPRPRRPQEVPAMTQGVSNLQTRSRVGVAPGQPGEASPTAGSAPEPLQQVIWFGNQGGTSYSTFGMQSILIAADALARIFAESPFQLLVVSKSRARYEQLIEPLPFPTVYKDWDPVAIFDDIAASAVCIIPNSRDAFSACKSANRAVLSLSLGTPVVASWTQALEPLEDCVVLDDWTGGLRAYLTDRARASRDVARARAVIDTVFSPATNVAHWQRVLRGLVPPAAAPTMTAHGPSASNPRPPADAGAGTTAAWTREPVTREER